MAKTFRRFRVIPSEEGQTLGNFVTRRVPELDKEGALAVIKAGGVYVNRLRIRLPMVRIAAGERITVYPKAAEVAPVDLAELEIAHRDPSFVVLNKACGVPVSQTRESARGTLAEALRRQLEQEGLTRPYVGVVHRLDQGASGLVLMTIRDVANKSLHRQFVDHSIRRSYVLRVLGDFGEAVTCKAPLLTTGKKVRVLCEADPNARPALTHFTPMGRAAPSSKYGDATHSLVQAELETGRTHQIRAHAAHLGHPIVGDRLYGERGTQHEGRELCLHARSLDFTHPLSGERVQVDAALPGWAETKGEG